MAYEDYTSRLWKVKDSDLTGCKKDDHIVILGPEDNVIVKCNGMEQYKGGMYMADSDTIEKQDDYTISIVARVPKYEIKLSSERLGSVGGSWTAEDHTPGPVDAE